MPGTLPGSVRLLNAHEARIFLKTTPNTVYVVHGAEPGVDSKTHAGPVMVFASPKKKFRDPIKVPQTCRVLIVPPFSKPELLEMQSLLPSNFGLSRERITQLFPLTGPRYYLEGRIRIATEFVHALLVQRLYLGSSPSAQLNIVTQERLLETAAANGYQLESLVHRVAVKGGELNSETYPAADSAITPCIYLQSAKRSSHTLQVDALKNLKQALKSSGQQESALEAAASLMHPSRAFKKLLVVMVTTPAHFADSYKELQKSNGAQPRQVKSVMQALGTAHMIDQDQEGGALTSEPHDSGMEIDHRLPLETHQLSTGRSSIKSQHCSD
ncbi:hypothetical protein WJX74_006148 [Apatococcus lobatus]|uniref:Uncharacterized protein n=1 Tax=Apatococcus lobatus TaxID=904363 RepID=A0AAW1QHD3_9CHLO